MKTLTTAVRERGPELSRQLARVHGVQRVLVCHRDGVAMYDEQSLAARESAAAAMATLSGMADTVCQLLALGASQGAVVFGVDSLVAVRPLRAPCVLVVVAASTTDVSQLNGPMRAQARALDDHLRAVVSY